MTSTKTAASNIPAHRTLQHGLTEEQRKERDRLRHLDSVEWMMKRKAGHPDTIEMPRDPARIRPTK